MDVVSIAPLLDQLGANLDNLEGVLEPILGQALSETATKLPALDQAKLYVLITYALESMLFCKSILSDMEELVRALLTAISITSS